MYSHGKGTENEAVETIICLIDCLYAAFPGCVLPPDVATLHGSRYTLLLAMKNLPKGNLIEMRVFFIGGFPLTI